MDKDPQKKAKGVQVLKLDVSAKEWSAEQSAAGADMAKRSMLNGAIMNIIVAFFKEDGFKRVPPALEEWFHHFWRGLHTTVISERANKVLREVETRDCPSKEVSRLKRWDQLRRSSLGQQYKRNELEVTEIQQPPSDCNELLGTLFDHVAASKPSLALHSILQTQDWATYNSQSIRSLYAETHVMSATVHLAGWSG